MNFFSRNVALIAISHLLFLNSYTQAKHFDLFAEAKHFEFFDLEKSDWHEEYAYTLGMQAFIFGFPWIFLPEIRWKWVSPSKDSNVGPNAPLNQFWHQKKLATSAYHDGGSPNGDTLYSIAWLDLSKEPLILSVPDTGDRYYTMQMASMDSDNFAYVGLRTTGSKAGNYAIIGPDWKGSLPKDVTPLNPSRTPDALIMGRTLLYSKEDIPNVISIQNQYKLTPLSLWGRQDIQLPDSRAVWKPYDFKENPLAVWKTMNRAMTENPPEKKDEVLLKMFSKIGLGPNHDIEHLDEGSKRGLSRAAIHGIKLLREVIVAGAINSVNGWRYPPLSMGRAGLDDDFLIRAAFQCLAGIVANDPEEATYLMATHDAQKERLSGEHRYTIHFSKNGLPIVKAFWSVTMYNLENNLVANPINRFKLGTYPKGEMQFDVDGGLTLYIQEESPGSDKESNWLPAPKGEFYLILRAYMPGQQIIEQKWIPPAINKRFL